MNLPWIWPSKSEMGQQTKEKKEGGKKRKKTAMSPSCSPDLWIKSEHFWRFTHTGSTCFCVNMNTWGPKCKTKHWGESCDTGEFHLEMLVGRHGPIGALSSDWWILYVCTISVHLQWRNINSFANTPSHTGGTASDQFLCSYLHACSSAGGHTHRKRWEINKLH